MPTQDFTTVGTTSWTAPAFVDQVTVTVIGGGGGGYRDCDDDRRGGGGGGGGWAKSTSSNVADGAVLTVVVGRGGTVPPLDFGNGCNVRNSAMFGTTSRITGDGISATANGGTPGNDGNGGSGGSASGNVEARSGQSGGSDVTGRGGGAGSPSGNCGNPGSRAGGNGVLLNGTCNINDNGPFGTALPDGPNYGAGGGGGVTDREDHGFGDPIIDTPRAGNGAQGAARIEWTYLPPIINSFTAGDNFNTDGIPDDSVSLSWNVSESTNIRIWRGSISPANLILDTSQLSGSINDNTGLQSVAGTNSPAEVTYTIRAVGLDGTTVTATATSQVTNDNTPNNYFVPSLIDVEPNTVYSLIPRDSSTNGSVTGMDMNHFVTGGPGVEVSINSGATWSTGSLLNSSGGTAGIRARVTSEPFNLDFTGQTNTSQQYSLTIGSVTRFFNITTRAPDVQETFDIPNYDNYVPNPDIDTIPDVDPQPENQSNLYIVSGTLNVDDIEIEVPIRTDDPNVQVRVRKNGSPLFGPWQDITQI
jgi:hypothetical protein